MSKHIQFALQAGLLYGLVASILMLPLEFPDKYAAISGAFINRFTIGFFIPLVNLNLKYWQKGLLLGMLLSLPDAIITNSFLPILGTGIVGGLLIGLVADKKFSKTTQ